MDNLKRKKFAVFEILKILYKKTDAEHPMTIADIAKELENSGIEMERKAISRHISDLLDAGYEIVRTKNGFYLKEKLFTGEQIMLLRDYVLSARYLPADAAKNICKSLTMLLPDTFMGAVDNTYTVGEWVRTENDEVLDNIVIINKAIKNGKRIKFDYYKYTAEGNFKRTSTQTVSPYRLMIKDQKYFLYCYNHWSKDMAFYRIERMKNVTELSDNATSIYEVNNGQNIDYKAISACLPYAFADKLERVTFRILKERAMEQEVIEIFGKSVQFIDIGNEFEVTVLASPMAMKSWAMHYIDVVEIVSPERLRNEMREIAENAAKKYQ